MLANQTPTSISHRELYEQDFYLWVEQAVKLLSENRLSELDRENLIEEIGDMGRSEKLSLESNLEVVLMHLLKYKYQLLVSRVIQVRVSLMIQVERGQPSFSTIGHTLFLMQLKQIMLSAEP